MTERGALSVREAGRRGGIKTRDRHGPEFYRVVGKKGGDRIKELIAAGKAAEKQAEAGSDG